MIYGEHAKEELKKVLCEKCFEKHPEWSDEIYNSWLLYIKGADRKEVIENTHFSYFKSIYYHFKKHCCYKKIAKARKIWFKYIKNFEYVQLNEYPWLVGLFYADGSISNDTKLAFALSLHEKIIVNEVVKHLRDIIGDEMHIAVDKIGNMYSVRFHSTELCRKFPNKKDKDKFLKLWKNFNKKEKMRFISGFIDGDGSCSFEDDINSISIYNKDQPFILGAFYTFLRQYGYVSLPNKNRLYISPKVGIILKPFILKRHIKKPYIGSVDVDKALEMLKNGNSVYKISKIMKFDKKTVLLALKRVYGKQLIAKYFKRNKTRKQSIYSGKYDLDYIFKMLKAGKTLNSLLKYKSNGHVRDCLFKLYGEKQVKPYIRRIGVQND